MLRHRFAQTALVGVLGLFAAAAAHASSYELGHLAPTVSALTEGVTQGSFSDDVNFTITAPNTFAFASVQNDPLSYTSSKGTNYSVLNISGLSVSLWEVGSNGATQVLAPVASGTTLSDNLSPGNYFYQVTGTGTGSWGGEYTISAAAITAPVPEPAESTLLVFGLGLVGFIALRKKQHA